MATKKAPRAFARSAIISSSEEFKNLKEDDKIYAYKRELVIKNLTKTFVGKEMYQIEFDTLSIL